REGKFRCGKHIPSHRTRWCPTDARNLSTQSRVSLVVACDLKCAILLELFDQGIGYQNFDARQERAILKIRHCYSVNAPQIVRLDRADVVAKATGERQAKDCRK